MIAGNLLIAYHGCDATTRDDLVTGAIPCLAQSRNRYDWLGPGAYFFEGDDRRALKFAIASHRAPSKLYTSKPIATPAVVGAVLYVGRWLDMTTQEGIDEFCNAYEAMVHGLQGAGKQIPVNRLAVDEADILFRALDSAVFGFIHEARDAGSYPHFQAVRGAFRQGREVAPNSGFHRDSHVQIALRDHGCVVGWFLPAGERLMSHAERHDANERLKRATHDRKPRRRVT
jgi:hypothetical protein